MRPHIAVLAVPALLYLLWALVEGKEIFSDVLATVPVHKLSLPSVVMSAFSSLASKNPTAHIELFEQDNKNINALFSWMLPEAVRTGAPEFFLAWFRNWMGGCILYLGLGWVWSYYIYFCFGDHFFPSKNVPTYGDMLEQIRVALCAMPFYALLPTITDCIVETGYTRAYPRIEEFGLVKSFVYFLLYMAVVEFGVYWSHRILHVGLAYKYLHYDHHKYNKEHSLSPFAGLAFHPLDGILQAIPYTIALFIFPVHYFTHILLLFLTGVWTTNIHDCLDGMVEPIMGGGYHTIHHTTYKDNYGHYFIFMDWIFGTLVTPEEYEERSKKETKAR